MDLVLLFPGQGSQKVGMGSDLASAFREAEMVFEQADDTLGFPLSRLCFAGPQEQLTSTENAQPALLAHGAAVWAVVRDRLQLRVRGAAGHSLGEFTAYHASGTFDLAAALRVVRTRGELMKRSGDDRPGTMAAVLGLEERAVEDVCRRASSNGSVVVPANYNDPLQLVISGDVAAVARASALAKEAGAKRVVPLPVSGAFHSPLMEVAADGLRRELDTTVMHDPAFAVWSNVSAAPVSDARTARTQLVRQLTSPVRWAMQVKAMAGAHPDALWVEMGPGEVLRGLVKRIARDVKTMACGTAADVEQLLRTVS
jgi:[acyl-carrier-protein] S-malonyltransferase